VLAPVLEHRVTNVKVEKGEDTDATERFTFHFGNKDDGPEAAWVATAGCDLDATEYTITGISIANPCVITVSSDPTSTVAVGDAIKLSGIVDNGPDGDMETALNDNHFEVTARNSTTITISYDSSGLTNTWASGGVVSDGIYPILGARANQIHGYVETAYNASNQVVRLVGCTKPGGNYSTINFEGKYGRNVVRVSGTSVGGMGLSGFSTRTSLLNNTVDETAVGLTEWAREVRLQDFYINKLDDDTGVTASGYGTKYHQTYAGRMANMTNTTYTVMTVDNVGINSASILLKLSYVYKEAANEDHEAGEISWLCPYYGDTPQTPIKFKDFQANDNGGTQPYLTWSVASSAGTTSDTGKFELKVTHADAPGTDNGFCTWVVEVLHDNIHDGPDMEWNNDVTIQNGGLSDTGGAE
jgi:hypothetical protein